MSGQPHQVLSFWYDQMTYRIYY